jgi:GNAT superfamily N-acetyltransferase
MNIPKMRPFRDSDIETMQQLIYQTIDDAYTGVYGPKAIQYFKDYHSSSQILADARQGQTMVLELNERIVGTGTICEQNIRRVFISPAFQGRSFGHMVMETLEKKALSMGLHHLYLDASLPSQAFYQHLGYRTREEKFIQVSDDERLDYFYMEKALNGSFTDDNEIVPLPGEHVVIRKAKPTDAPAMARINVATWRDSYGKFLPRQLMMELSCSQKQAEIENFFARWEENQAVALVAENKNGEMMAFIMAGKNHRQDLRYMGEIYNLHVTPAFQSQGIGRYLVYRASQVFRQRNWHTMMVWALAENPSRRFYEKLGGRVIAQNVNEYRGFTAPVIAYGWNELICLETYAGAIPYMKAKIRSNKCT